MLTRERTSKNRTFKYAAVVLALLAVLVLCLASCNDGAAKPVGAEYVTGTANKVEYNAGESFDCTGAQIKVTYDDGVTETKSVTKEMVGNAPLAVGTTAVSVTYSENGATIVSSIPVTVKDPLVSIRATAVDSIYAFETAKNNLTDLGVAAFVREYVAKVNTAADADAVKAIVENFKADVVAHLAAKDTLINGEGGLNKIKYADLHDQFKADVESQKNQTLANIKAAGSVDEAKAYLAAFETYVKNKRAEQEFFEKFEEDGTGSGQIYDKMDILNAISQYQQKNEILIAIVQKAYSEDPTYVGMYNAKMYGDANPNTVDCYEDIRAYLAERYNYITLAINIDGQMEKIIETVDELLTTPIDRLVDEITSALDANAADVTVYPAKYALEEDEYVDGANVTLDLLRKLKNYENLVYVEGDVMDYQTQAIKEFGPSGLRTLLNNYGVIDSGSIIEHVIAEIVERYEHLMAVRADARNADATLDVVALIDAASKATAGAEKRAAVDAAWAAYKAWGTRNNVFTLNDTSVGSWSNQHFNDNISYTGKYDAVYAVTLIADKWNASNLGEWSDYALDGKKFVDNGAASYITTYFIPNFDLLITATQEQDAYEVKALTDLIQVVLYSDDADIDDLARITAARNALEAYRKFHDQDNAFLGNKMDETEATIKAAEERHEALVKKAKEVNEAIDEYEKQNTTNGGVTLEDYRGEGKLYVAYKLYREFADMNKDTKDNDKKYTDVIYNKDLVTDENGEATSGNEINLLACLDVYFRLEYEDQRHTGAFLTLTTTLTTKIGSISVTDTEYREALKAYFQKELGLIGTETAMDFETTIGGVERDNFNYIDIYNANVAKLNARIDGVVANINNATGAENGELIIPQV